MGFAIFSNRGIEHTSLITTTIYKGIKEIYEYLYEMTSLLYTLVIIPNKLTWRLISTFKNNQKYFIL